MCGAAVMVHRCVLAGPVLLEVAAVGVCLGLEQDEAESDASMELEWIWCPSDARIVPLMQEYIWLRLKLLATLPSSDCAHHRTLLARWLAAWS